MLGFGATKVVEFLPEDDARAWVAEGLREAVERFGAVTREARLVTDLRVGELRDLDDLFELMCGLQAGIGQADVEFTLAEIDPQQPGVPPGFEPLGNPVGQLMHTFARGREYVLVTTAAAFRVGEILLASVARELGRIGIHRTGGHRVQPAEFEADAELSAVALGMGVWVANGSYMFENACCGGGCGVDLKSLRAGLSMPEACYALALDGHRRGLPRRALARHLAGNQKAAFKRSWGYIGSQPEVQRALQPGATMVLNEGSP